ncbi:hypothetical protein PPACK8108_LOCUS6712 [Phakopsora pachyrhizi]|uniref:Zn(2)-C6 fungal-type domain-containing protein n=1 Tax=Phakopsora pachyrhizi TaxID=170000 RepID=A0AAV0AUC2_PHAPC|nr:hypothetical protein PPACK8108_LOCUS6712 [Phakopsora pachyrhizi]
MPPDWIFTNVKNPPDIGPQPLTHSNSPPVELGDFTLMSDKWKDCTNGFNEVLQYKTPCEHCSKRGHVCCQATVGRSKKCEGCRVLKITCKLDLPQVFLEGRKFWCNPRIKAYAYEHPIPEVPTRIQIQQREAGCDVVEDVDKMSPRAHIRHVQQAQIVQKTVQIEVRKEVEEFRANKLLQMPSTSQSIYPQLPQISSSGIEDSLCWSFGNPPNTKEDFNQDKQVALRNLLNQHRSDGECVKKLVNMA